MQDEERPNREGYLDFKLRIENGDAALKEKAAREWQDNRNNLPTARAWYYDLWFAEEHLQKHAMASVRREDITREAAKRVAHINGSDIRLPTAALIKDRIEAWDNERFIESGHHFGMCKWTIGEHAALRHAQNPDERESESWFWAKYRTEQDFVNCLVGIEVRLKDEISQILDNALQRERLEIATETESIDIPGVRESRRDGVCDREH